MADPGDIIGQAVVNVRKCQYAWPCGANYNDPTRCPGCQDDGTYNAERVATVERRPTPNYMKGETLWRERPVGNGDTDEP